MARHASRTKILRPAESAVWRRSRYVPAIDGLRAFSVLAVILYHMSVGWAPGGLMGVTVFFVISGYLINGLLVSEYERTERISLKQFWLRRVRRIIPAVLLAVAGTVALCALMSPSLLAKARPDILPSLLFYNNWWQIFRDVSYFEAAGAPSPLTHYWSLAIEEQFYILWPLVLLFLLRIGVPKKPLAVVIAVLAVTSGVEMAVLYDPQADPSRLYYGTDTRAMSLLAGACLALVWPSAAFAYGDETKLGPAATRALNVAGVVALAGITLIIVFTTGFSAFPYLGGIALVSVLSVVLIAALVMPGSWVARFMELPPLVWIGKRSYGMYLWHYPIILLTSRIGFVAEVPWWVRIAQLIVIVAIADLSFRFVENPVRRGAIGRWIRARKDGTGAALSKRATATICIVGCLFAGAIAGGILVKSPIDAQSTGTAAAMLNGKAHTQVVNAVAAEQKRQEKKQAAERKKAAKNAYEKQFEQPHYNKKGELLYEPLLIGDSVPAGAIDQFYQAFPYGCIDAVVGRKMWESPFPDYAKEGKVGTYVVFCLGTNNAATDKDVDELLSKVRKDQKVILVNTRSTYEYWEATNATLERAPKRHKNIVALIDWYSESADHIDEYFWDDATHLRPEGAEAYIALIKKTIMQTMRDEQDVKARQEQASNDAPTKHAKAN